MAWHQARLRVIAFHLGVQPNGEEITMSSFNFFGPEITDEIRQIVLKRILGGGKLANRKDLDRRTAVLVLTVVREMNPYFVLYYGETDLLTELRISAGRRRRVSREIHSQTRKMDT